MHTSEGPFPPLFIVILAVVGFGVTWTIVGQLRDGRNPFSLRGIL